jgi:LmbE family N-acetylglucosaminyl deacetylase
MSTFTYSLKNNIQRVLLATLAISLLVLVPRAQPLAPTQQSSEDRIALYQALLDLTNPWTVMCVAAHPDDEDGTSLIVMRRKYGAHTVSLFSTFGEGGQNAIGHELYEELGAIRARETMAASEIQGSEPHFLGLKDFGYSKTRDEAFKFWGHEEALRRMVLEIRKLHPEVIITNHSTTSNDHGQHQATALMVVEAFDAAADPNKFPEQLKDGVTTWQVQRLFVRARGNAASAPDAQIVTIDPNERDSVRGLVYAEEALRALQKHATQGPWPKTFAEFTARFRAFSGQGGTSGQMPLIRYALVREAKGAEALPKDSHNFLDRLQVPEEASGLLAALDISGRSLIDFVADRDRVLTALLRVKNREAASDTMRGHVARSFQCYGSPASAVHDLNPNRDLVLERLGAAIKEAAGIKAAFIAQDGGSVVGGEHEPFALRVVNNGSQPIQLEKVVFNYCAVVQRQTGAPEISKVLPPGQAITIGMPSRDFISALEDPERAQAVMYAGVLMPSRFQREAIGLAAVLDGVHVSLPVDSALIFLPDVEITNVAPKTAILTSGARNAKVTFSMQVRNNRSTPFNGRLAAYVNQVGRYTNYYCAVLAATDISLKPHETREFKMALPQSSVAFKDGPRKETLEFPYEADFRAEIETRGQPRWIDVGRSNAIRVDVVPVSVAPNLNVGFVRGFDYSLPDALASLGVGWKELSVEDVKTSDLSRFTSIIVDNRVYEAKPELIAANQKLLDYANAGGNLIIFYHKSDEWNPDARRSRPQLAPYKLTLGNERITDENAPIIFLEPNHPLLNLPNKLGPEDFVGWIQERGLYYPREWDPQFHALLQSNDPGETPLKGGLLVADYGRGHYIYTSMVWYRQLRAGVPGAYRMLANMISYGRN